MSMYEDRSIEDRLNDMTATINNILARLSDIENLPLIEDEMDSFYSDKSYDEDETDEDDEELDDDWLDEDGDEEDDE